MLNSLIKSLLEPSGPAFRKSVVNIFITGGTTGIGLELAQTYLREGNRVGICARDLSKCPVEIRNKYKLLKVYELDVTDRQALKNAVADFVGPEKILDMMVANAGRSVGAKNKLPNFDVAREIVDINVVGVLNAFEVALEYMLPKNHGHLVATSSVAGLVGLPGVASYSASKAYVLNFCESLGLDLAKYGITVTAILPGFVDTPLTKKNNHKMPFLMTADKAAVLIKKALDEKKSIYIFPWQMNLVMSVLRRIPRSWYRWLMKSKIFNYSEK